MSPEDDEIITFPLTLENMRGFMTVHSTVNRDCPFCGAKAGQACTTLRGRKLKKTFHKQRFRG